MEGLSEEDIYKYVAEMFPNVSDEIKKRITAFFLNNDIYITKTDSGAKIISFPFKSPIPPLSLVGISRSLSKKGGNISSEESTFRYLIKGAESGKIREVLEEEAERIFQTYGQEKNHVSLKEERGVVPLLIFNVPEFIARSIFDRKTASQIFGSTQRRGSLRVAEQKIIHCKDKSLEKILNSAIETHNAYYSALIENKEALKASIKEGIINFLRKNGIDETKINERRIEAIVPKLLRDLYTLSVLTNGLVIQHWRTWEETLRQLYALSMMAMIDNISPRSFYNSILDALNYQLPKQGMEIDKETLTKLTNYISYDSFLPDIALSSSGKIDLEFIFTPEIKLDLSDLEKKLQSPRTQEELKKLFNKIHEDGGLASLDPDLYTLIPPFKDVKIGIKGEASFGTLRDWIRHRSWFFGRKEANIFSNEGPLQPRIILPEPLQGTFYKQFIEENIPKLLSAYKKVCDVWEEVLEKKVNLEKKVEGYFSPLSLLPFCLAVEVTASASLASLLNFLRQRIVPHGHPEYVVPSLRFAYELNGKLKPIVTSSKREFIVPNFFKKHFNIDTKNISYKDFYRLAYTAYLLNYV